MLKKKFNLSVFFLCGRIKGPMRVDFKGKKEQNDELMFKTTVTALHRSLYPADEKHML